MAFKDTLKELRQEKKLTQDNLASMIHVSRSAIAKWEAGLGLPQEESIELLCQVFNKTKEELFKEYVEQDLVDKNIKIHSQKNRILILSFLLCVICFIAIFLTFMILNRKFETFKKELIRQLDYKTGMQQTRWTYENLTKYSKWVTFGMETYSLIEVKRNETSSFSFFIQASFKNDKQITSMNRKIECFIP